MVQFDDNANHKSTHLKFASELEEDGEETYSSPKLESPTNFRLNKKDKHPPGNKTKRTSTPYYVPDSFLEDGEFDTKSVFA